MKSKKFFSSNKHAFCFLKEDCSVVPPSSNSRIYFLEYSQIRDKRGVTLEREEVGKVPAHSPQRIFSNTDLFLCVIQRNSYTVVITGVNMFV